MISEYSVKASVGAVKRVMSGYLSKGSRFHPREIALQSVYVGEFDIGMTPVTVHQYAAFLNSSAIHEARWWSEAGWAWFNGAGEGWGREDRWQPDAWEQQKGRPYHPVVGITWYEAQAYCAWVAHEKQRIVRLPSEDEWEHAARGDDGRPFPWGEVFDEQLANTVERGIHDTVDVASVPGDSSPYGVLDMAGNVQEWTSSIYKPIDGEVFLFPDLRTARGGSFNDVAFGARTSFRRGYPPGYFFPFLGFRVVVANR